MRHELAMLHATYNSTALNTVWKQLLSVPASQDAAALTKVLQQLVSQHTISEAAAGQVGADTLLNR